MIMRRLALSLPAAFRPAGRPVARGNLFTRLLALDALWRGQRRVAALDDHLLRDIGLTRAEALTEAERPIWSAPDHWQQ
jgi:uncharacterized protein YjiS (DUF1127 family)